LTISIETLKCPSVAESHIEVVERKGLGHPDISVISSARS
jgi:S-adenosylmethionine synthetase